MTHLQSFISLTCPVCKNEKPKNSAFCKNCYFMLPREMQRALWKRMGQGYELAVDNALQWFKDRTQ